MRKAIGLALALAMTAGVAMAGGGCPAAKSEKCEKGKTCTITGEVTAVDAAAGKLTVTDDKGVATEYSVTADAKIAKPGKKGATLADIAVGDKVAVMCLEKDGANVVKSVKVKKAPKKKGDRK